MDEGDYKDVLADYEKQKQFELEEHWRARHQRNITEQEHYDALIKFTD